jgi:uroporphyrin-III C-methyltransferase
MGKVYLIGAGPGDAELLTVKAARLLSRAQIVYHDSLVSDEVLHLVSPRAEVIDVGKRCGLKLLTQEEINSLLIAAAAKHEIVIRLKGGDPLIFGRAGEEIDALRAADVEFEIVPGITAALAAAASAKFSLTDRRAADKILFATFHRGGDADIDWSAVNSGTTLALYMPGGDYAEVSAQLRAAGLPADLPCVIVSNASRQHQRIHSTNLGRLSLEEKLPAPAVMIIGRVATSQVGEIRAQMWRSQPRFQSTVHSGVIT